MRIWETLATPLGPRLEFTFNAISFVTRPLVGTVTRASTATFWPIRRWMKSFRRANLLGRLDLTLR